MDWWKTAVGAVIVLFAVREMFDDLFHPTHSGALSEWIASGLFCGFRRWPWLLPTSGPLAMGLVILTWAILLATGFAFIYWQWFPADYRIEGPVVSSGVDRWWWSFYYSLEMMTTLGLGDIRPNPTWLKILSAGHTLLGFSCVTASITWIVLVFPALRRMRTLARKVFTLTDAEERTGVSAASVGMHVVLMGLAEEVLRSRVDFVHFPLLFYFYAEDPRAALPGALTRLINLSEAGTEPGRDQLVRLAAAALMISLNDLASLVGERLNSENRDPRVVFRRFAELHTPQTSSRHQR